MSLATGLMVAFGIVGVGGVALAVALVLAAKKSKGGLGA